MPFDSIDEARRKAFETAWREGHPQPIDLFLPPEDDPSYLPTLEELVHIELEFLWKSWGETRHDADTLDPAAADTRRTGGPQRVEHYLNRFPRLNHPDIILRLLKQEHLVRTRWSDAPLVDEFRRRFPEIVTSDWQPETLVAAEAAFTTSRRIQTTATAVSSIGAARTELPRTFGNYELLEEIGRGGMGVVYRARQSTANRIVALKVVRRDYLESLARDTQASALERFQHEIEAAARLEHENIVPVYDVGDVDGEPFYSMKYVEGQSLAETLYDGPIPNREGSEYLLQVARAMDAAHRQEVLHRDLKPQNILVEAATGRILVVDFGLAKLLTGKQDLTQTGEMMGSPPYMSPEQAQDASGVTAMTDVYALGATFYHVLTGRPPFQAAHALITLHQVMHQDAVPPRQLNPAIDRDLETICLKCLEKEPGRRYESAQAMADEIDRYLRNEPILARPVGIVGRTSRWCRRNPVMTALISASLFFLVAALVAISVGYVRTTSALRVAEASERHARQTVDEFCTRVSEDLLLNRPGLQPLRKALLGKALEYYEQFLDQRRDDPSIQDELGLVYFRVGQITELIESPEAALVAYRRAVGIQTRLAEQRPADHNVREALGDTHTAIGVALATQGQWEAAADAHQQAAKTRETLAAEVPDREEYRRKLANSYMNLGLVETEQKKLRQALERYQEAQSIRRKILAANPRNTNARRDLAKGCFNLGNLYRALDPTDWDAVEASIEEAVDLFEDVLEDDPKNLARQYALAVACRRLGDIGLLREGLDRAAKRYVRAISLMTPLARSNPDVSEYQAALARMKKNLGLIYGDLGELALAYASFRSALPIFEQLVADYPDVPEFKRDLAVTLRDIALVHMDLGEFKQARENLVASQQYLQQLVEALPDHAEYAEQLDETKQYLQQLDTPIL